MTEPVFVKKWIARSNADSYPESCGGWGGWFARGDRWATYIDEAEESKRPYLEALRADILKLEIQEGGDWHQRSEQGTPLFSDGTVGKFSFRAWGDLLAAIWSEHEQKDYQYMDFYMS